MDNFTVKIEGLEGVQRKLKLLPDRLGNRAMRRGDHQWPPEAVACERWVDPRL